MFTSEYEICVPYFPPSFFVYLALLTSIFVSTVPGAFSIVVDKTRNITEDVFKLNITGPNVQIFQVSL